MEIVILIFAAAIQLLLSGGILAIALYFTGEGLDRDTLGKCLGISLAALIVSFVPVFGFMSIVIWVAAVMMVFEKTILEAIIIGLICGLILIALGIVLRLVAAGLTAALGTG